MTPASTDLEERLARFVEHHVLHGERLPIEPLCAGRPDLVEPLRALVDRYLSLTDVADRRRRGPPRGPPLHRAAAARSTASRRSSGSAAAAWARSTSCKDLTLDRIVAGKIVRRDRRVQRRRRRSSRKRGRWRSSPTAASSASSSSATAIPRSSSWSTSRGSSSGGSARRSSSRSARASLAEVCDAVQHAHALGIQHRDLKPSNIMVDAALRRGSSTSA